MLAELADDTNLLKHIITDDETCVYGYDFGTNNQASQWKLPGEPRLQKHAR